MELWFINRVCSLLKKEDSDEVMSLFVARTLAVHFSPFDAQYLPHHRNSPASLGDEDRWCLWRPDQARFDSNGSLRVRWWRNKTGIQKTL
jgi:hypothetical protein